MATSNTCYWKRLWRWTTSETLSPDDLLKILDVKEVKDELKAGLRSYKPLKTESFAQLQAKHSDQTKLLSVVQTLQQYINVDSFQVWEILKHYLCDISYGSPANALKNVAFVDTRPSFLLPNVWKFYFAERLFLLKLMQYVIEFKDDEDHKYHEQFKKIVGDIGLQQIKSSLVDQFEKVLSTALPPRKIQHDFSSNTVRLEWVESNLREQLAILQCLLLIATELPFSVEEFSTLFGLFRKHSFGKRQAFNDMLEDYHREQCLNIMFVEVCIFMVLMDCERIKGVSQWIESTKEVVERELTKLQLGEEHSALLMCWMMLTLQSEQHARQFENHYQQFGATALKLKVFKFLEQFVNSPVFSDKSKCALTARRRVFTLLNQMCDKFDSDGSLSHEPGVMPLCALLLETPPIAEEFWRLHAAEQCRGVVSLWHTALEYFPFNFAALSVLASGLARAGKESVRNLIAELKALPVYTERYDPRAVPLLSPVAEEVTVGRDYFPLHSPTYRVEAGSTAAIMERKEGTMIHFRTPYSYWTVLNSEIERALDRKGAVNLPDTLQKVYEGTKVLRGVLTALVEDKEIPKSLVAPSEGVFDVLVRFMKTDETPLPLLVACLEVCAALIPVFPNEIHLRLINTGLLPRVGNSRPTHADLARGASLDSSAVGSYLVCVEQPAARYPLLEAYVDMLQAFHETSRDERITAEVLTPGVAFLLSEVLPNMESWRFSCGWARRRLLQRCVRLLHAALLPRRGVAGDAEALLRRVVLYSLHHTQNARELLRIVAQGNEQLERMMHDETNWVSGRGCEYITTTQRAIAVAMLALRLKPSVTPASEMTPLEHLVFAQNHHNDVLRVVPRVTSYINHAFNKNLAVLCCRLLKRFAESFQMSLFASLDMTSYQVRVMFLERLRDNNESTELKIAILEFVATCVGKQPGLTEAFFKLNHVKVKEEEKEKTGAVVKKEAEDSFEGILGYMADYLGTVKSDAKLLHSPLLACIMALFHALWRNYMQVLVAELRQNPKFWDHMTSPLFSDIQPRLRTYAQIYNVLGIELFLSRNQIEPSLKEMLEQFFDTNKKHLDKWINYIFSFEGRDAEDEVVDKIPVWLSLLTSWKDFTTIFCKCLPISLNIAHKAKMVAPCMRALLHELEDLKDGRLVVILAELYVVMLANWKDDCFDERKANAKQIDNLLTNTAIVYDCLHPRAKRAILSIGTVAISSLDYEIKANSNTAQSIIRSVTNINSLELEKMFDDFKNDTGEIKSSTNGNSEDIPPVVLSLALLEQCLDLYDDMYSLSQWFQSTRFTNKLLCCLQMCLQNKRHYHTSLAALRCLTAYSRGPFSKDLLLGDVDQFLWMQLLPPKFEPNRDEWKVQEWWRIYRYSLDFITMMVMKHEQFFVSDAITFVGVHLEQLVEAILLPSQVMSMDSLNLCASALNLVVQLVKFESRWRIENVNSLLVIMRSTSACLNQCVSVMLRSRRTSDVTQPSEEQLTHTNALLHRTLEILHMSTLCLLSFSPSLLSLLAEPTLELGRWQPLAELDFSSRDTLAFGTLLTAAALLTRSLNHSYHSEEGSGSRSPRGRRRVCSCGSPGDSRRVNRSESLTSISSGASAAPWLAPANERLLAGALEATLTLLASQALLAVRDPNVSSGHKQLIRRELSSELTVFHDFVRKRILCAAHARPHLVRNKLGAWPLAADEEETKRLEELANKRNPSEREQDNSSLPPPPPPKRASQDSMREYILRKHYLTKCAQTPTKEPPSPVSHSTPTSDKKKDSARSSKRVSWAETTTDSDDVDSSLEEIEPMYSNLTEVHINNDEDYFHFMSVVFLFICQMEL